MASIAGGKMPSAKAARDGAYMLALMATEKVRQRLLKATKELGTSHTPKLPLPRLVVVGDQSAGKAAPQPSPVVSAGNARGS